MKAVFALAAAAAAIQPVTPVAGLAQTHAVAAEVAKQRLIVLSDIEADPDDTQSFIRLFLYANQIDIEGLVATTSTHMKTAIHPDSIRRIIDAYGKVQPKLALHEPGFPTATKLTSLVREGQPGYGMAMVGAKHDTAGSRLIIEALDRNDPRPLWVSIWGGANTLAQALYSIKQNR